MSSTPESIFLTGATGYAGSAILPILRKAFPETPIAVLVRQSAQGDLITSTYPKTIFIQGTHDSTSLLTSTVAASHIVVHASDFDHAGATHAMLAGIIARKRVGTQPQGVFIGLSGAASTHEVDAGFGELSTKIYSDVHDWDEIMQFSSFRPHVEIERKVMRDSDEAGVRAVVLAPPEILRSSPGIGKNDSESHGIINIALDRGKVEVAGRGENRISWIHVDDLAESIVWMIRESLKERSRVEFGAKGYYFVEAGEISTLDRATIWADELVTLGALDSSKIHLRSRGELDWDERQKFIWGGNMRIRMHRLQELGWKPSITEWESSSRAAARQKVERRKTLEEIN